MRPLVYDFGQLNTDTERDYTRQIVQDRVRMLKPLSMCAQCMSMYADASVSEML